MGKVAYLVVCCGLVSSVSTCKMVNLVYLEVCNLGVADVHLVVFIC